MKRINAQAVNILSNLVPSEPAAQTRSDRVGGEGRLFEEVLSKTRNLAQPTDTQKPGHSDAKNGEMDKKGHAVKHSKGEGDSIPDETDAAKQNIYVFTPFILDLSSAPANAIDVDVSADIAADPALDAAADVLLGDAPANAIGQAASQTGQEPLVGTTAPKFEQVVKEVVSVLEGSKDNTEIAPLLNESSPAQETHAPEAGEELSAPQREVLARTPHLQNQPDRASDLSDEPHSPESISALSCPPENASENSALSAKSQFKGSDPGEDSDQKPRIEQPNADFAAHKPSEAPVEKLFFSDRPESAQPAKPAPIENLFDRMIEEISSSTGETPRMEIALKPDSLGRVVIDLVMGSDGMTAKIKASDEGVRNLIASQIHSLTDSLASKGVKIEQIDVVYTPFADKSFDGAPRHFAQNSEKRSAKSYGKAESIDASADPAPYEPDGYLAGDLNSSVEYRA